ncbi:MAG: sugar ABC transporter permease [Alphaproteobacteria bacterium]|nr:sugar ABC transporter permease [Alphaproteobacteria bacterium]
MSALFRSHRVASVAIFAPALLIAGALMIYPFLNGVVMAFTDATPTQREWAWVGVENFDYVLSDRTFWEVLTNSLVIVGLSVAIAAFCGLLLALLLNEGLAGTRLYRSLIFQGWVVPWITIAVLWGWLFNFDHGIVNHILVTLGIVDRPLNWLAGSVLAKVLVISGFVWRIIPFMMVMILAALQGVPSDLHEAARIDGAGYVQRLRFVTLPLVRSVIIVAALLQSVRLFQELTLPLVTTQGGPINATTTLSLYTYKLAFERWDFGLAAAVGSIWSGLLILISAFYVWIVERGAKQ